MKSSFHGNQPPRILIVEDGLIMARDIERRLQSMGYGVVGLATSGDEAIRAVTNAKPDLVLMDVRLKGSLDGIQVAAKIHSLSDVPVVYVTAYSDDATVTRARQTEPFGYVLKPFEEKELRTTIEMALYRHSMHRKMHDSEQRYKVIAERATLYLYGLRLTSEGEVRLEYVSDGFACATGLPPDALASLQDHVHPYDVQAVLQRMQEWMAGRDTTTEYRLRVEGGGYHWMKDLAHVAGARDQKGDLHIIGGVQDIRPQKEAEREAQEAVRARQKSSRELSAFLEEQADHVISLLESHSSPLKAKQESWEDVATHVSDVLSVYRTVHKDDDADASPLGQHVQTLTANLFKRYGHARVTYTVDAAPVEVDARLAVRLLLVTQELVINSLRHAFPNGRKGHVRVALSEGKGKELTLEVSDDGVGMKKDFDLRKAKSAGFEFIRRLCADMPATTEVERGTGVMFKVVVPSRKSG